MKKKKEKNVLTKRFAYDYNELDSVAEFLEQKAAEGWELTSKTGVMFGFRKCEPKKVKISVELVYANKGDSERERFVEYCEASGWKHIFSDGKIQIFETEDLDTEPIHSDPEVKLALIHKKCRVLRMILPPVLTVVIFALWKQMVFPMEIDDIFQWNYLLTMIGFPLLGIMMIAYGMDYWRWYRDAKAKVSKGERPMYKRTKVNQMSDKILMIYIFGGLWGTNMLDAIYSGNTEVILVCGGIFVIAGSFLLLYPRISAKNTRDKTGDFPTYVAFAVILFILLSAGSIVVLIDGPEDMPKDEDMPLLLIDLGVEYKGEIERYTSQSGTILGRSMYYSDGWWDPYDDEEEGERMGYTFYVAASEKIRERILKEKCLKATVDYEAVDEPAFAADIVYYSQKEEQWLLVYDEGIVEFWTSMKLTDKQKWVAGEMFKSEL